MIGSARPMGEAENASGSDDVVQILCPIYNEGENVKVLYQSLSESGACFDRLQFIYDIDTDTSLPYIEEIQNEDSRVVALKNEYGPGVVRALSYGFAQCKPGPVLVVMGDNSDKLSIIPEMVELWRNGAAIVSPSRYMPGGKQHGGPPLKGFLSQVAGRFLYLCGFPTSDVTNNFKLYDGKWLAEQTIESTGGFEIALELCYKAYRAGKIIEQLPTEWWDRTEGESRFKLWAWIPRYLRWYFPTLGLTCRRKILAS